MKNNFLQRLERLCKKFNFKLTEQRKIIARIIDESEDHPYTEQIFERAIIVDPNINLATVYRTLETFLKFGLLKKHYFGDNKARYEAMGEIHHDHIIDVNSGTVTEFSNSEISNIIQEILNVMGYDLVNYALEIYGVKKNQKIDENHENEIKVSHDSVERC